MKEFILQSEFPCLVATDTFQKYLDPTDILTIKSDCVLVYPVENRNCLPFKLDLSSTCGKNYRFIEHDSKLYCFIFSSVIATRKTIEHFNIDGKDVDIFVSNNDLSIKCKDEEMTFPLPENSLEYVCKPVENFIAIWIKTKSYEMLFIYNPQTKVFKSYKGYNFKIEKAQISFSQKSKDFAKSKFDKKLILNKDEIKEETSSFQKENFFLQNETICYAFLDCILNQNYTLARELLSLNLKDVEDEKFKDFFGKFYKFFPLSPTKFVLIYNNETKVVVFTLNDKQITDFEFVL